LRAVSKALSGRFRKTDMVCRYGGEEFCVFLLSPNEKLTLVIAEECRQQIEDMSIPFEDKILRVTISIGVAEFPSADVQTLTSLIERADAALYEAKRSGRNAVKIRRETENG
jgi:diguanylate cyclase (GGDEF)-like protein